VVPLHGLQGADSVGRAGRDTASSSGTSLRPYKRSRRLLGLGAQRSARPKKLQKLAESEWRASPRPSGRYSTPVIVAITLEQV